jgi:hypothetical protein
MSVALAPVKLAPANTSSITAKAYRCTSGVMLAMGVALAAF